MSSILENISLQSLNTFGIDAKARFFAEFSSIETLQYLLKQYPDTPKMILGGGSNILFTQDFEGLVLHNRFLGIEKIKENSENIWLKANSGENWHSFVLYCLENDYAGLENLSLIPGTVGAAPMQNIGAYGVEVKDYIAQVNALHIESGEIHSFSNQDCAFGYRESIFKRKLKGQYVILEVVFKLNKIPKFNTSYGAIETTLHEMHIEKLSIQAISEAVCKIRRSKLPNPAEIGNGGSFFKNPEISMEQFQAIQQNFPSIIAYPISDKMVKVPAGWLIEQCGFKGLRRGAVGVHAQQALVLVNYGGGSGKEILNLSKEIQQNVWNRFGIPLEPEINMI